MEQSKKMTTQRVTVIKKESVPDCSGGFSWDVDFGQSYPLTATDPIRFEAQWSGWTLRRKSRKVN